MAHCRSRCQHNVGISHFACGRLLGCFYEQRRRSGRLARSLLLVNETFFYRFSHARVLYVDLKASLRQLSGRCEPAPSCLFLCPAICSILRAWRSWTCPSSRPAFRLLPSAGRRLAVGRGTWRWQASRSGRRSQEQPDSSPPCGAVMLFSLWVSSSQEVCQDVLREHSQNEKRSYAGIDEELADALGFRDFAEGVLPPNFEFVGSHPASRDCQHLGSSRHGGERIARQ